MSGKQFPSHISSGVSHTVAIGQEGGVFAIGSAILGKINHNVDNKLKQKRARAQKEAQKRSGGIRKSSSRGGGTRRKIYNNGHG